MRKRPLTKGFRSFLNGGGIPWTGAANVTRRKDIQQLFPEVELIEDPITRRVDCYRVIGKGATTSSDLLVHEFTLKAPPGSGDWVLQHLCQHDSYTGILGDPHKTSRRVNRYYNLLDSHERDTENKRKLTLEDVLHQNRKQVAVVGRQRVISFGVKP